MSVFLGFVSAAQVPSFSANDDYDEVNLNIRMLDAHANVTEVVTVTGTFAVTMAIPEDATSETLMADTSFKAGLCTALLEAGSIP